VERHEIIEEQAAPEPTPASTDARAQRLARWNQRRESAEYATQRNQRGANVESAARQDQQPERMVWRCGTGRFR
jgi:hypothetical protein